MDSTVKFVETAAVMVNKLATKLLLDQSSLDASAMELVSTQHTILLPISRRYIVVATGLGRVMGLQIMEGLLIILWTVVREIMRVRI